MSLNETGRVTTPLIVPPSPLEAAVSQPAPRRKLTRAELEEKLQPFAPEFCTLVLAYSVAPTPILLESVIHGLLRYNVGETFDILYKEKGASLALVDDLKMDSLTLVELSFQAEDCVDFVIQLEDFANIKTLGDLIKFLNEKIFLGTSTPVSFPNAPSSTVSQ